MAELLIKGGTLVAEGKSWKGDILVADGKIKAIGESLTPDESVEVFDAEGCVVTYGLADVHVHLREPGYSAKETITTGTRAAARGGVTTVCSMPNLQPAPDAPETIAVEQQMIDEQAVIEVRPFATISKGRARRELAEIEALRPLSVGYSDDGNGIQTEELMRKAMQRIAAVDGIIAAHCEDDSLLHAGYIHDGEYARQHGHKGICSESEWGPIKRDVKLAEEEKCRYHVCHISTKESVEIIREAKQHCNHISCETAPHYLVLCDADLKEEGRFKMNPPLRSAEDRAALIEGIKDGTIEIIATDHAPHTAEEKSRGLKGSAMGIVGIETAFAICYTHLVRKGVITIEKLIALMSENPRRIFRLGGAMQVGERADIAVFDTREPYKIDTNDFLSMGKATPFEGEEVYGRCVLTLFNGEKVWNENK
ncbi:MAG: dihydroorotase [Rikenellaceae bacterium]|nr:dihydroorotase [Rikenellaceae bacterium]